MPVSSLVDSRRVALAQRKAMRLFPGPIGEALVAQLDCGYELRSVLGPGSLSQRLLAEIESLPDAEGWL